MKRFAFFPGCLIPARHPAMEFAIRETMPKLGVELTDLPGASCCPDPIYFKSKDKLSWLAVAARNLSARRGERAAGQAAFGPGPRPVAAGALPPERLERLERLPSIDRVFDITGA